MKLSGTIPQALGQLSMLEHISLKGNRLSGPLPPMLLGGWQKLETCALTNEVESPGEWNTNQFVCPAETQRAWPSYPAACRPHQTKICERDYTLVELAVAGSVSLLLFGLICFTCGKVRQNQLTKRGKVLIEEVTRTSDTVLSDLSDRRSGHPVVIVDGKSMLVGGNAKPGQNDSADPRHVSPRANPPADEPIGMAGP